MANPLRRSKFLRPNPRSKLCDFPIFWAFSLSFWQLITQEVEIFDNFFECDSNINLGWPPLGWKNLSLKNCKKNQDLKIRKSVVTSMIIAAQPQTQNEKVKKQKLWSLLFLSVRPFFWLPFFEFFKCSLFSVLWVSAFLPPLPPKPLKSP